MRNQPATRSLRQTRAWIEGRSAPPRVSTPCLAALFCVFATATAWGGSALAATITVTSSADSGAGTLRQAVLDADPGDLIVFSGNHTIVLASDLPDIDFDLTIDGEANTVILDGDFSHRSGFELLTGAALTLRNLELRRGEDNRGGAIRTDESAFPDDGGFAVRLVIESCVFRDNAADGPVQRGGAIYAERADVAVLDSFFYDNVSGDESSGGNGGAVYSERGNLVVERSWFSDNRARSGGAIYFSDGQTGDRTGYLKISDSTFFDNSALSGSGGALRVSAGPLPVSRSVVVRGSLFEDNTSSGNGGAILINRFSTSHFASIENSTFYGNHAGDRGGALFVSRTALDHVSVYQNTATVGAGGVHVDYFSRVRNSIVAGNGQDDDGVGQSGPDDDCAADNGSFFEHTLVETLAAALDTCVLPASAGNLVGVSPSFDGFSPADNGGETETLALGASSPAIGAGDPATCRATDQRGYARTAPGCDLGAFETATNARCVVWDGTTERSSLTAEALHLALAAGAGADLKIAGNCLGTTNVGDVIGGSGDEIVAAYVDQSIDLEGGHRAFDWTLPADGQANPTVIDALGTGRVVVVGSLVAVSLRHLVLRNGLADVGSASLEGRGGAVYAGSLSSLTLERVTVRDSLAHSGGGIATDGTLLTISASRVRNNVAVNRGGGLYMDSSGTDATIDGSTFDRNLGQNGGGAIYVWGDLDITNSTLSGNTAFSGAGMQITSTASVTASQITIANNRATTSAEAIGLSVAGDLDLDNSIVSDSVGGADCGVVGSGSASLSFSLIEDGGCGLTPGVDGNVMGDPGLEVLAPNTGIYRELMPMAWSHEIEDGGGAHDSASNASCEAVDQRGYPRDDGLCDMGAFEIESDPIPPTVSIAGGAPVAEGDAGLVELRFRVGRPSSEHASFLLLDLSASTATAGDDYFASGGVYIPPGVTLATIYALVEGDTDIENDETVVVDVAIALNATTNGFPADRTIADDDNCPPSLDLDGVTIDDDLDYLSPGAITATDVTVDAVVGFHSGTSIALADGFSVTSGSEFSAVIDPGVCP